LQAKGNFSSRDSPKRTTKIVATKKASGGVMVQQFAHAEHFRFAPIQDVLRRHNDNYPQTRATIVRKLGVLLGCSATH
jgi:hypothetical protein